MNVTFLLDLVLIALIALFAFFGYRKGALATLISLVGGIAALFVSMLLSKPLAAFLSEAFVEGAVRAPLVRAINGLAEAETGGVAALMAAPPEQLRLLAETLRLDWPAPDTVKLTEDLAELLARPIAENLSYAVSFFALFFLLSVAVRILIRMAKKFNHVPLLGGANRLFGLALGALQGLLFAWALASVLHLFLPYLCATAEPGSFFASFDGSAAPVYGFFVRLDPVSLLSGQF